MEGIIARLMIATGADAALIRLWDDAKSALTLAGQRGFPDYYLKALEVAGPGGAADWVFKSGEPIVSPNIAAEPRFKGKIHPYASKASPDVVDALLRHVKGEHAAGITTSAPGFFGPQGREIPGLSVTVPRLQEELAALFVKGVRAINFEMETSLLLHLGALMGYRCGSVCAVVANRPKGTFLTDYSAAVERGIVTALEALRSLS